MELSLNLGFPVFSSSDRDAVVQISDVIGGAIGGGVEAESRGGCNYGYLRRLEDEMRKIEPFRRELPLCLILLENMIERFRMRTQHENEEEATETVMPSIEELFPLKRKSDDEESGEVLRTGKKWMSCEGDSGLFKSDLNCGTGCDKPARLDCSNNSMTENCGEFLQSKKISGSSQKSSVKRDNGCLLSLMSPTSVSANPIAENAKSSGSSRLVFGSSFVADQMKLQKKAPQQQQQQLMMQHQRDRGLLKKQRRSWSPELHRRFLVALQKLGGAQAATPKQIRAMMKVQGLTNDEVKSHLQKFRLNIRRLPLPSDEPNSSKAISGEWNTREGGEEDEDEDEDEDRENSDGHSWVTGLGEKQLVAS